MAAGAARCSAQYWEGSYGAGAKHFYESVFTFDRTDFSLWHEMGKFGIV